MTSSRKRGFTLVELLVVIAIIGVLVGLLLPAVQAAREAARRMQCTNNIKQIALALHNYESTHKKFPPGGTPDWPVNPNFGTAYWNTSVFLLPYMEQSALYNTLRPGTQPIYDSPTGTAGVFKTASFETVVEKPIGSFRCPSDPGPELRPELIPGFGSTKPFCNATLAGTTEGMLTPTSNYVVNHSSRLCRKITDKGGIFKNGAFYADSKVGIRDIIDGTTNTIAVGERAYNIGNIYYGAANYLGGWGAGEFWGAFDSWFTLRNPINSIHPTRGNRIEIMSSNHSGGANVAMFDGSVRFLSETIDLDTTQENAEGQTAVFGGEVDSTMERLVAIADGQVVSLQE